MNSISIEKRSIKYLINSFGYFTKEWPLFVEINNIKYRGLLNELINENEIIETSIKNEKVYFSRAEALKYFIAVNSFNNTIIERYKFSEREIIEAKKEITIKLIAQNIVFDLGGVIADESDLDVRICEYLDTKVVWGTTKWSNYGEYSNWLVETKNPKWYDYYAQAEEFNVDQNEIINLHTKYLHLVRFYDHSIEFIKYLFDKGHKIFFITGCNSKVLALRLKLYNIEKYVSGYVTSDTGGEIGNKEPYYTEFFKRFNFDPKDCLLITDNFFKDGLPANRFNLRNALFIEGGRNNKEFDSNGIQPDDLAVLSLLVSNQKNSPDIIFDSFKNLHRLFNEAL
ncbi:MAG: HAD hydrolase-like protein [Bacteroidetes bacterium]|nr:HAD hydrolase-like protein [Bacteroidota bacterium]